MARRSLTLVAVAAATLLSTLASAVATPITVPAVSSSAPFSAGAAQSPETASVVSQWSSIALTTLAGDTTKAPQEAFVYLAFMHAAVYDAVAGIEGRYQPYRFHAHAPRHASSTAAAAAAAHLILITYSPYARASLDAALAALLAAIPDGRAKTDGVALGELAARHIITLRAHDGRNAPISFATPPAPGVWRPTPPAFALMAVPWLGFMTPLLVRSAAQFAPPPPPALTSTRYTRDFAEVKAFGSATSTARTADQTATAQFFSGNPLVMINAAMQDQVAKRRLNIVETARMFAAVTMSINDAIVTTWRAKFRYGFWRPITAIQLADQDGNPATVADPTWTPLIVTPPYPDYTSGYNAVIASASTALEGLLGRGHLDLILTSTAVPGVTRHYDSGPALRADVVNARVWLGIHFRFADTAARDLATRVADWTLDHYFEPTRDHDR